MKITKQPVNTAAEAGSNITLTCEAEGATSYQWYEVWRSGTIVALSGRTYNSMTFPLSPYREDQEPYPKMYRSTYFCRVSDGSSSIDSDRVFIMATHNG